MKTGILCFLFAAFAAAPIPATAETLTLRESISRAAQANPRLLAGAFDEKIAAEAVTAARSSYFPRVDLQGGYTLQKDPQAIRIRNTVMETQDPHYGTFNLTVYQTIFDFGRTQARAEKAELLQRAASEIQTGEEKDLSLQVVEAYYRILEDRKRLEAAADEVAAMENHLRMASNKYEQGVVTRNDVLQAEVRLASSRQRHLTAENNVEKDWLALNYLIGNDPGYRADLEEKPVAIGPSRSDEKGISRRAELAALRLTVQASELEVREAKADYLPEFFLRGAADYTENSKVREQTIMYGTVGVKANLFAGKTNVAKLRQAVARLSQNRLKLAELERTLQLELDTASRDLLVARERIGVMEKAIAQSEENLRINRDRYAEKVGTATDVIDAQTLLTQARTDYYRALYDYDVAVARVQKARGEL